MVQNRTVKNAHKMGIHKAKTDIVRKVVKKQNLEIGKKAKPYLLRRENKYQWLRKIRKDIPNEIYWGFVGLRWARRRELIL